MSDINKEVISELKDILADDFKKFIETFIEDTQNRLKSLDIALGSRDVEQLKQESHSLKGSSSNLGVIQLSEACYNLEKQAHAGIFEGSELLVEQIKINAQQVIQDLQIYTVS